MKEAKLFGKNEDGEYLGRIEEIGTTRTDQIYIYISNRKSNLWILSLFIGYRQLGVFKATQYDSFRQRELNSFYEGQDVIVTIKDGEIVNVKQE